MNWGSQEVLYLFWTYMLTEEGATGLKSNQLYWLCYAGTRKTQNTLLNDRSLAGHFSITEGSWGHSFGRNRSIFLTRQFHYHCCYCSVAKLCPTLQSHGLQQTRLTCPPPSQAVCSVMSIDSVMLSNHIILCHPLLFSSSLFQHQGLFQWVSSSHQVAKILELQHQSFQWMFSVDFL